MNDISVTCKSCGRSFSSDSNAAQVFCTYCGTQHQQQSATNSVASVLDVGEIMLPDQRINRLKQYLADNPNDSHARQLELLFAVRYKAANRKATEHFDTFLRLWFDLVIQSSNRNNRQLRKTFDQFFSNKELTDFLSTDGAIDIFKGELRHAVEMYFRSCRKDRVYTTFLFGFRSLTADAICKKAANEAVVAGVLLPREFVDKQWADMLEVAAREGFLAAFPEGPAAWNEKINQLTNDQTNG